MHYSVLLNESIAALAIKSDGTYVDGTFGRGGHSREILAKLTTGKLIAFDRDLEAIEYAKVHFKAEIESGKLILVHAAFSTMANALAKLKLSGEIDGVLLDLGVSSPQLDVAERGFSFMKDGPLDMRMDQTKGESAKDILINYDAEELARIFREYGEERHAWRIAQAIKEALERGEVLDRTLQLAKLIEKTIGKKEKKHPATRCFQALRICVNQELDEVATTLNNAFEVLNISGRLAVISFHSLEDRIVKQFMTKLVKGEDKYLPRGMPVLEEFVPQAKWCVKQGKASDGELKENVRSRSAILRAIERL